MGDKIKNENVDLEKDIVLGEIRNKKELSRFIAAMMNMQNEKGKI